MEKARITLFHNFKIGAPLEVGFGHSKCEIWQFWACIWFYDILFVFLIIYIYILYSPVFIHIYSLYNERTSNNIHGWNHDWKPPTYDRRRSGNPPSSGQKAQLFSSSARLQWIKLEYKLGYINNKCMNKMEYQMECIIYIYIYGIYIYI